jgi:hypothetical protein
MAYDPMVTAGNLGDASDTGAIPRALGPPKLGGRNLFMKKNMGAPGKLGKTTTKAESLSKLRGIGALR